MSLSLKIVPGDGPKSSPIWLIGEAPGGEEDRLGKPFIGPAGHILNSALKDAGIARSDVYVTNLFRRRPHRNNISNYYLDKKLTRLTDEGFEELEVLRKELEQHKPNVVVALGARPLYHLAGLSYITKWRGSVMPCTLVEGLKVYSSFHPSFVMRMMQEKGQKDKKAQNFYPVLVLDMERAAEQSEFPEIRRPEREFTICESYTQAISLLESIPPDSLVAVDIETIPGYNVITRVGFSTDPKSAFTIPFILNRSFCWTHREFCALLVALDKFFRREDISLVFQNGLFDMSMLVRYWHLGFNYSQVQDTMILHHATYPHLPKGLDWLSSFYTWEPYYKDDGKSWDGSRGDRPLSIYNCRDAAVTREIFRPILQDSRHLGMVSGYERSMSYVPSLMAMGLRGVRIDEQQKGEIRTEFETRIGEIDQEIEDQMGRRYKISTSRTKDLVQLLYVDCGFTPVYKGSTLTTANQALLKIKQKYPDHPIPGLIQEKRKLMKLVSQYLNMKVSADGRVRTTYDPTGTTTWRLSSRTSDFGKGGNLQNIPKRTPQGKLIRKLFIPDPGKVFLAVDLKQAEAMVVAYLANEQVEIEAYESGEDAHWVNTRDIFGLPRNLPYDPHNPEHVDLRFLGKTCKHAGNYGMGWKKLQAILLSMGIVKTAAECKDILRRVQEARPMIQQWKLRTINQVEQTRTLITPLGRKRIFWARKGPDMHRKALAFVPQSTVGELLCIAIRDIYEALDATTQQCEVLMNVHDEVIVQCPEDTVMDVARAIKPIIEIPLEVGDRTLIIPAEFSKGPSWGELEEFDVN